MSQSLFSILSSNHTVHGKLLGTCTFPVAFGLNYLQCGQVAPHLVYTRHAQAGCVTRASVNIAQSYSSVLQNESEASIPQKISTLEAVDILTWQGWRMADDTRVAACNSSVGMGLCCSSSVGMGPFGCSGTRISPLRVPSGELPPRLDTLESPPKPSIRMSGFLRAIHLLNSAHC